MSNLDKMYRKRGVKVAVWFAVSFCSMWFQVFTIDATNDNLWRTMLAVTVWIFAILTGGLLGFHVTDDYRQHSNSDREV